MGILPHGEDTVCISAKTGEGIDQLIEAVRQQLERNAVTVTLQIPYSDAGIVDQISAVTAIQETTYENDGIHIRTVSDSSSSTFQDLRNPRKSGSFNYG